MIRIYGKPSMEEIQLRRMQ
ncbi:unnamed protein product, partial [Allacma fusca]